MSLNTSARPAGHTLSTAVIRTLTLSTLVLAMTIPSGCGEVVISGVGGRWTLEAFVVAPGFSGSLTSDMELEPGQEITLRVSGVDIAADQMLLWVGDYQRTQLLRQQVTDDGRLTTVLVGSEVPDGGEITFTPNLPVMEAGTFRISIGDMNGPRTNAIEVTVGRPERRMTQAEAGDLFADGIVLMGQGLQTVFDDPDEGWDAFKQDVLGADGLAGAELIFSEVNELAETARAEYASLEPELEQQFQAFLWNVGLLPMFDQMRTNAANEAEGDTTSLASFTFMDNGRPDLIERRIIHTALFKIDMIGARLLAAGSVADLVNIVAIAFGGEALPVSMTVTVAINGLRILSDAMMPTETASVELQPQFALRAHPQFRTRDLDNRWIYWARMEPQTSIQVAAGRLAGLGVSAVVGESFQLESTLQEVIGSRIVAALGVARQLVRRLGFDILSFFDDTGQRAITIKIVADTSLFTEPLDSTDLFIFIPVFGEAVEEVADFMLSYATEPAMTISSPAFPDEDIRAWRELTEEHLAINHPELTEGTDALAVTLQPFSMGTKNLAIAAIPFPVFPDQHVASVTAMHWTDYDQLERNPRGVWHFDRLDHDSAIDALTGSWITESTSLERRHLLEVGKFGFASTRDSTPENQGFTLSMSINGSTPIGLSWFGEPNDEESFIATVLTLQPGLNTVEFSAVHTDPQLVDEPVFVHLRFPSVINPMAISGREARTDLTWEVGTEFTPTFTVQFWTPPSFEE